ncbi:MAG TPA: CDP-archaeol synthase [Candidatus Saccharimonadales bacterium]|nr:CDP-archaeol synthase [Candidatus Saccharimonadales bacterium]
MENLLFALWFFAPAGVANMTPIFAAKAPGLSKWNTPVDFGLKYRGKPLFGPHKTVRGIVCGTIAGTLIFLLQTKLYASYGWAVTISDGLDYSQLTLWVGVLLSFGALLGDLVKSFFKRRVSVDSGKSWFPFDQIDYIIGGLLLSSIVVTLTHAQSAFIIVTWFILHLATSYIGYLLGLKKDPI